MTKKPDIENTDPITEKDEKIDAIVADITKSNDAPETPTSLPEKKGLKNRFIRLKTWCQEHKKKTAAIVVILLIAIAFGIPVSRYSALSLVKKQAVVIVVNDSQTGKPVTEAEVTLGDKQAKTNKEGKATFSHTKLGKTKVQITKAYYERTNSSFTVGLKSPPPVKTKLVATGRQVPITITNKISGAAVSNVLVQALGSKARSDKNGKVVLVLPADKQTATATLSLDGYNNQKVTVKITAAEVADNKFSVTPAGKIYFLSKLSGKIDVVKTNLDGTDRKVVLAGTGNEEDRGTVLLASKDWKYLALQSKRDSSPAKLYLINTATDQLTTMDEGNAAFTITGWLRHDFIYRVDRNNANAWQSNDQSLKGFNADTGKISVLDQTSAEGTSDNDYAGETYGQVYALNDVVLFSKSWSAAYLTSARLNGKQASIISVKADGTNKNIIKTLAQPAGSKNLNVSFDSRAYDAGGVYFKESIDDTIYKYDDGKISTTTDVTSDNFYTKTYPTFLQSPDSKQNFWSESRDGKNTLFVGDSNGENGHQIATLSEYTQYGWYSNDYLLVSKNSSELYIMPRDGKHAVIKISDYHKPQFNYVGYGGGYGGI